MREIKFRLFEDWTDITGIYNKRMNYDFQWPWIEDVGSFNEYFNKININTNAKAGEKSRNILMQYTGLKDKNGVEIYEGDIIKYISFDGKEYTQECPSLIYFHFWQETKDNNTVEVIGNIYENPELLESEG